MANYYQISLHGQQAPGATSDQVLYEVPSTKCLVAASVVVCNTDETTADEFILCAGNCAGATSAAMALYWKISVAPKDTFVATIGMTLAADSNGGNQIVVQSTNGTLTYTLFGQVSAGVDQ